MIHVPDPLAILQAAVACLKPGGICLVEDAHLNGYICQPQIYAHHFLHEAHQKASLSLGADLTRGARIGDYTRKLNLCNIGCDTFVPLFGKGIDVKSWTTTTDAGISEQYPEIPPQAF